MMCIVSESVGWRYEMDAVVYRTAMSPGIREQHDQFPVIADPAGAMVMGQVRSLT